MPRRADLETILLIGSGPIVIGQACEFDYSGTQACRVLRDEGFRVVLVNSNPATIMTDPEFADATYIEPLNVGRRSNGSSNASILTRSLPTLGGPDRAQPRHRPHEAGVLDEYSVEMIGASVDAIHTAEDRSRFKEAMTEIGLGVPALRPRLRGRRGGHGRGRRRLPGRWCARRSFSAGAAPASPTTPRRCQGRRPRLGGQPDLGDLDRAVGRGLEGIRTRGDARPRRQRGGDLLDRELRRRWASTPATRSRSLRHRP